MEKRGICSKFPSRNCRRGSTGEVNLIRVTQSDTAMRSRETRFQRRVPARGVGGGGEGGKLGRSLFVRIRDSSFPIWRRNQISEGVGKVTGSRSAIEGGGGMRGISGNPSARRFPARHVQTSSATSDRYKSSRGRYLQWRGGVNPVAARGSCALDKSRYGKSTKRINVAVSRSLHP